MTEGNEAGVEATRVAIECLMLWMEEPTLEKHDHIAAIQTAPGGADQLVTGLLNVGMILAFHLAKASGAEPDDFVGRAREILSDISINVAPRIQTRGRPDGEI